MENKKTVKSTKKATSTKKNTKDAKSSKPVDESTKTKLISDNVVFELTIPASTVAQAQKQALQEAKKQIKQDGFRKGKVPEKLLKQNVNEQYLLERTVRLVLPDAYEQYIKENNLKPLTEPDIKPLAINPGEDWKFEISIAQKPVIDLTGFEKVVAKTKKNDTAFKEITSKESDKNETPSQEKIRQQKIQAILTDLLSAYPIAVPELLLRRETEFQLHELEHQLEHMGLKMAEFLERSQKKLEDVQNDYAVRSLGNLQVEMLLGAIIEDAKIEVSQAEITQVIEKQLESYPQDKRPNLTNQDVQYVYAGLVKQKALDYLLNL